MAVLQTGVKNAIEIWRIDLKKKYIVYSDEPETKAEWLSELEACIIEAQTLQASQGSIRSANLAVPNLEGCV